jgi:hypothetical protein
VAVAVLLAPVAVAAPLELFAPVAVAGPEDTDILFVRQEVSEFVRMVKVADWPTAPVLSRKFKKPLVPTGRLTCHVKEVPVCLPKSMRG